MTSATLTIDLAALADNWRSLDRKGRAETAAVVKADAYGLGMDRVAPVLAEAGARLFFVAIAEEGAALRRILGPGPTIHVLSGHMAGDTDMVRDADLRPMINSTEQLLRHLESLPGHGFGIQLDTGMNRLGMEPAEWASLRDIALSQTPCLLMSHLACADMPDHPMNASQRDLFIELTEGADVPRSLSATGGILLGEDYHFDVTRPGVGLYGGLPFAAAQPVVALHLPVIQTRDVAEGETVGYANAWTAPRPSRVATVSGGYADGIIRAMGGKAQLIYRGTPLPVIGRVSMDMLTVDVTALDEAPEHLDLLCPAQTVDDIADWAGTIGYEILTALGARHDRVYLT